MSGSEAVTDGIRVRVTARYSADHSIPGRRWFFLYTITIRNEGDEAAQLLTRHWVITDATGRVEKVEGPGVVGEQPVLEPGEAFEYTSGCPLPTPFGSMEGHYRFADAEGRQFPVEIARFDLREPGAIH